MTLSSLPSNAFLCCPADGGQKSGFGYKNSKFHYLQIDQTDNEANSTEAHNLYSLTLKNNSWHVLPDTGKIPLQQGIQLASTVESVLQLFLIFTCCPGIRWKDIVHYEVTTGLKWDGG